MQSISAVLYVVCNVLYTCAHLCAHVNLLLWFILLSYFSSSCSHVHVYYTYVYYFMCEY